MKKIFVSILALSLLASCQTSEKNKEKTMQKDYGLRLEYMDTTVRPQDDFYMFVNGNWQKKTVIPPDRSRWGAFNELRKQTDSVLLELVEKLSQSDQYAKGTDPRKALDFYASIMDTATRNKMGIEPAVEYLNKIQKVKDNQSLLEYMIENKPYFSSPFLSFYVRPDMKNSKVNVLYLTSGSLGLPERDYYLKEDEDSKEKRKAYLKHIEKMWKFLPGQKDGKKAAQNIMEIETLMARHMLSKEERRQPEKRYNPVSLQDLQKAVPSFDWKKYFTDLGIHSDTIILTQPGYLEAFRQILTQKNWNAIRDYLTWTYFRSVAGRLSEEIADANWQFYGKTLYGTPQRRPLKERALSTVNRYMGEALGQVYVDEKFPPEAKEKAKEMVKYLQKAYKKRIDNLTWMSPETKEKAKEKVDKLLVKIGYPDKWKDYSSVEIKSPAEGGTFFENAKNLSKWHFDEMIKKLGKPVDRTEWGMSPQTVNAYYNPSNNEIVFPAAILQPPFYNFKADAAVNFGGMGAVIGHEISHGFDDQGAKFDVDGNLNMWWTPEDFENFKKLGQKLAGQYSKIEVLPGVFVNGEFTLGENIADVGGVNAAFTALQMYLKDKGRPEKISSFTPEERFFISWATVWRTKSREEALKNQIKTDPHSPGQVRATQPLRNMEAFHREFEIKPDDKMYLPPEERVIIW